MIYDFNSIFINTDDISSIWSTDKNGENYPFILSVKTKAGMTHSVSYRDKGQRDREAVRMADAGNREQIDPVTCYDVERIVERIVRRETEKVRRDIKILRKDVTSYEE